MASNRQATLQTKALVDAMKVLAGNGKVALQKRLGEAAITQAALGIRRSVNPYGEPFAPLISRAGIPLRDTGNNIQRSWTAEQKTPTSFVFGNRFKYLATHQYGATIRPVRARYLHFRMQGRSVRAKQVTIPRRQMVPEMDTGGLGPRWTRAFERAIRNYLKSLLAPGGA